MVSYESRSDGRLIYLCILSVVHCLLGKHCLANTAYVHMYSKYHNFHDVDVSVDDSLPRRNFSIYQAAHITLGIPRQLNEIPCR